MTTDEFIEVIGGLPGWETLGGESIVAPFGFPDDLRMLIQRTGGVRSPSGLCIGARPVAAQEAILGERSPDDRSAFWVVIAEDGSECTAARAVLDIHPERRGRIYDASRDGFGVAGSQPVVASSGADFLERLIASGGSAYWQGAELGLGDAYD